MRILVAEDEQDLNMLICRKLRSQNYSVDSCRDGQEAIDALAAAEYDALILDIMMPGADGYAVLRTLRSKGDMTPVLFLTARDSISDRVRGLDSGANDSLVKPFFQEELLARIRALLRRYEKYRGKEQTEPEEKYMEAGGLRVSLDFNEVMKNGESINMTDIEYKILRLLMRHHNKIFSIQNIYESVWEKPYFYDANNTVMVHIRRLRMAIEDDPRHPSFIKTEWGRGYRFVTK